MPGAPAVDVLVAVVTFNSARHVPGLLSSLEAGLDGAGSWRLVVTDNDSSDGTVELVRRLAPGAVIVEMGRNAGYAAGINAAVAAGGRSEAVLVLNPDVVLRPASVVRLRAGLAAPQTGICAPLLLEVDGRIACSMRREPSVRRAFGEALLGGRRAGRVAALGEVVTDQRSYDRPCVVDWATGAALLVSRACFDELEGFDESFFLYSEETDFALRARDAGWALRFEPRAEVVHAGGDGNADPQLYALLTVNRFRLFRRRNGRLRGAVFWAGLAAGESLRVSRGRTHRAALRALVVGPSLP